MKLDDAGQVILLQSKSRTCVRLTNMIPMPVTSYRRATGARTQASTFVTSKPTPHGL
jgi:hypothetical protein